MGTRWERPTVTTTTIAGGYVILRSHAVLALWQAYRDGHVQLLDVRTALAAAEVAHRKQVAGRRTSTHRNAHTIVGSDHSIPDIQQATGCSDPRKTRSGLKRLANAGVPAEQLRTKAGSVLHIAVRVTGGVADRPVPVPRRWLRALTESGTAATVGVALALLLRGSFLHREVLKLGGTCRAAWIAQTFTMDERTAKAGRAELIRLGWVASADSPVWHRQRHGATFTLNPEPAERHRHAPESPPRPAPIVPSSPPPWKNKNLPLRGTGNQNQPAGVRATEREPTLSDVQPVDLERPERTVKLLGDAQRRGLIGTSQADRLRFFTTVQHARRRGARPEALLASLARRRCWHYGTQANEDDARRVLAVLDGPQLVAVSQPPGMEAISPFRPSPENPPTLVWTTQTSSSDLQPIASVLATLIPAVSQSTRR